MQNVQFFDTTRHTESSPFSPGQQLTRNLLVETQRLVPTPRECTAEALSSAPGAANCIEMVPSPVSTHRCLRPRNVESESYDDGVPAQSGLFNNNFVRQCFICLDSEEDQLISLPITCLFHKGEKNPCTCPTPSTRAKLYPCCSQCYTVAHRECW